MFTVTFFGVFIGEYENENEARRSAVNWLLDNDQTECLITEPDGTSYVWSI